MLGIPKADIYGPYVEFITIYYACAVLVGVGSATNMAVKPNKPKYSSMLQMYGTVGLLRGLGSPHPSTCQMGLPRFVHYGYLYP